MADDATLGVLDGLQQPRVHQRTTGNETALRQARRLPAFEIRHHAAGLANEQHARRNVPRREAQLPEALEPTVRHRRKVQRGGASTSDSRCRSHYRRELPLIRVHMHEMLEWESRADECFRWILDA